MDEEGPKGIHRVLEVMALTGVCLRGGRVGNHRVRGTSDEERMVWWLARRPAVAARVLTGRKRLGAVCTASKNGEKPVITVRVCC